MTWKRLESSRKGGLISGTSDESEDSILTLLSQGLQRFSLKASGGILLDAIINLWYTFCLGCNKIMLKFKNKGFTYIELALAMAIIAFIILAFTQLFLSSTISVKSMEFQTLAYNFAGDRMEDIKNNEAFENIGNPWYPTVWETDSPTVPGKSFTRNVTVSELASSLKRVDIEVKWMEGGEQKSIEISSLIADK